MRRLNEADGEEELLELMRELRALNEKENS